jgi:C-terminal processing protease CtpA/Prc
MKRSFKFFSLLLVAALLLMACQLSGIIPTATGAPQPAANQPVPAADEPYEITGSMDYTNAFINTIFEEHAVALVDMYAFIGRDEGWEIPIASQTLGYMNMDEEALHAEYILQLPARPTGQFVDVDNNGQSDAGVQVFAVCYWPNVYGGPYSEGDDRSRGWPGSFSSVKTDPEREDEVNGGKLIVWAGDGDQSFPTGYGADNELFTADDPVAPIPAGYTIVDLDETPFAFSKEAAPDITLYEPSDFAVKDYSALTYTEAFDQLVAFLRINYAFNGIPGKQPDWDALVAGIRPRIEQAQQSSSVEAYYLALRDFTWAFKDGHVGMGGSEIQQALFTEAVSGGYGFSIRELDDGSFVVIFVLEDGPAAQAGMEVGAVVTEFDGKPIAAALAAVVPWALPQSTEWQVRYQQARYLLRAQPGAEAAVTFANPGAEPQTVTLAAVAERDSFARTSIYYNEPTYLLPVEFRILDSGVGYVALYSNMDDIYLTIRLFERALQAFEQAEVTGVIIDMRYNGGGTPIGLAGFLHDQEIPLGQSFYYSEATGKFEPEGLADKILPNQSQYRFDKIAVLVGPACSSACEEEAYGFSQVPGAQVVGMFPTSSMFGEVGRGQFTMPEGFAMQFPTGRFLLPDGSLFLEGTGVQPTLKVPITLENVTSEDDVVLQLGERVILQPLGAGITPAAPPRLMTPDETEAALSSAKFLDEKAREEYTSEDMLRMDTTFAYTIALAKSAPLIWAWGWCAKDQATLDDNLGKMEVVYTLNGQEIAPESFLKLDYDASDGQRCTAYLLGLTDWQGGENHAIATITITAPLNDGKYDFLPGYQIFDYAVYVKP